MNPLSELFENINAEQDRRLEALEQYEKSDSQMIHDQAERIATLESYIEQFALLFRALHDTCMAKGVFSKEDFKAIYDRLDMEDGVKDDRLSRPH